MFSDFDDDAELGLADEYMAESRAAKARGDHETAAELYTRANDLHRTQSGLPPDDAEPAPDDAEAPGHAGDDVKPGDIEGPPATDLTAYVNFDSLSEQDQEDEYERVMLLASRGASESALRREWPGEEYSRNLAFSAALLEVIPGSLEALRVLEAAGVSEHPSVIRWAVSVGRLLAREAGDASTIPSTATGKETKMDPIDSDTFNERADDLMTEEVQARARGNLGKSKRLQREIRALFVRQYGTEPAIGSSGGPTA